MCKLNIKTAAILATLILSTLAASCKSSNNAKPKAQLIVQMHDEPFLNSGKTVSELNIRVERVELIRTSDSAKLILSEEPKSMNILAIQANDPVVLSDLSLEPGWYEQLRLVLSDENTIVVDGETHPITIPSASQTGVKFRGPFYLAPGKLFRINLDFKAPESVIYNKGQGYKLKPVIEIASTGSVIGIFRGKLSFQGLSSSNESVIQLYNDNIYRMKVSEYPDFTIHGHYFHDTLTQVITFTILSLTNNGYDDTILDYMLSSLPSSISFPVIQWSLDDVIMLNITGDQTTLGRVQGFSFSSAYTYTNVAVTINYPDDSMDGKPVVIQLKNFQGGSTPLTKVRTMTGASITETFQVANYKLTGGYTKVSAAAYLFNSPADINMRSTIYNGEYTMDLAGANILESSENIWQPQSYIIEKSQTNSITVEFPTKMKPRFINADGADFAFNYNNPWITWETYPGAAAYALLVFVPDRVIGGEDNEMNERWDLAFSTVTQQNSVEVFSGKLDFTPVYSTGDGNPSTPLSPGDIVRLEIYALDGSATLNTANRTGALYMDSTNIVVPHQAAQP